MKRILLSLSFTVAFVCLHAQQPVGHFSLIPKAGLDIANLTNNDIFYGFDKKVSSRYNARFAGGVEAEYQMLSTTGISLGVFYLQQGCRFPDYVDTPNEGIVPVTQSSALTHSRQKMNYVQVPLLVNQYILPGLAVKAGVQMGILTSAHFTYNETIITHKKDAPDEYGDKKHFDTDMKDVVNKMDVSIPIGVSYEYQRVMLDLRYHIGLKNTSKIEGINEKNKFFTFTVGYRVF